MNTREKIIKQQQHVARCETAIALEKLKNRRADTRRKIEFGGLVIKAGMDGFNKSVILGALDYTTKIMKQDPNYEKHFELIGDKLFLT